MSVKSILIIASKYLYASKEIIKEAKKQDISANLILLREVEILSESETEIFYKNQNVTELFKNSLIIFRGTRKNYSKALSLSIFLNQKHIPHLDSFQSFITDFNKSSYLPLIESELIPQPKSIFLSATNSSLIDKLKFPVIIKPADGTLGNGVTLIKKLDHLKPLLKKAKKRPIIQEKIDIKKEYRIFILADKILGIVEKLPPKGSLVANYAAGSTFLKCDLPLNIRNEALKITKQLGIDIAGFDIAEDKNGNFFTLEVNRCPEFKAFSEATSINVAKEIINHIKIKYNL